MKLKLIFTGKTEDKYIQEGLNVYENRIKHYLPFSVEVISSAKPQKNQDARDVKEEEGRNLLKILKPGEKLYLFDEGGKQYSSTEFAAFMEQNMTESLKVLALVIGGPYGFSDEVIKRATGKISLSKMTFTHQMIRLIAIEQIYRAMTIIKNEPYHHV